MWGADPFWPISTKIGVLVEVHDVIIQSNFGLNIFRDFRSTGGQHFRFPNDFAGHCYSNAAATAQAWLQCICYMLTTKLMHAQIERWQESRKISRHQSKHDDYYGLLIIWQESRAIRCYIRENSAIPHLEITEKSSRGWIAVACV